MQSFRESRDDRNFSLHGQFLSIPSGALLFSTRLSPVAFGFAMKLPNKRHRWLEAGLDSTLLRSERGVQHNSNRQFLARLESGPK
jgi:hypothetical protein